MIDFTLEIPLNADFASMDDLFKKKPAFALERDSEGQECRFWGDPLPDAELLRSGAPRWDADQIARGIKGHFYYIVWNRRERAVTVGNSLFSILPVYCRFLPDRIVLAANALDIAAHSGPRELSRRFALETTLFNYPLFNNSVVADVSLLPSNSALTVSGGRCVVSRHTRVADLFEAAPQPWRKALSAMSDVFLGLVQPYLPDEHYWATLTGGFDGRTLAAAGLCLKKDFSCYAFGSARSADLTIAADLAAAAKIPFLRLELDEAYAREKSLECGLEFVRGASGTATFARAHYLHAARELAPRAGHIVTGNFGSEVFRAPHLPGAMISANLFRLFNSNTLEQGICAISGSSEFSYLKRGPFRNEWEELKEDLRGLPCYSGEYRSLSRNQRFYVFMYEEIFRKYFGAEMVNQFRYVKNRTPFLDRDFLKAVLRTGLAGVHSAFFEHNPLKRYKGQVLYARIIRQAFPAFGRMMTDKGYRPDDLLERGGKLRIAKGYLKKILRKGRAPDADPYAVSRAFAANRDSLARIRIDPGWFNAERIASEMRARPGESLYTPLSLSYMKELLES